jgi:hypothetical protein
MFRTYNLNSQFVKKIMNKKTLLIALTLCIAVIIVVGLYLIPSQRQVQQTLSVQKRLMKDSMLTIVQTKELDVDLYMPITAFGNQIYSYSDRAGYIVVLDSSLTKKHVFGKYGQGPGEMEYINDIAVNEQGIHLADRSGKLVHMNHAYQILSERKIDQTPFRSIQIADNTWFLKTSSLGTNTQEEFAVYTTTGNRTVLFQRQFPHDDADIRDAQLDGDFFRNNAGRFFRVSQFCGQFFSFDSTGTLLYNAMTIDAADVPKFEKRPGAQGNVIYMEQGARMINPTATADAEYLYILSNAPSPTIKDRKIGRLEQLVVDVYKVSNGTYICSFMAPNYNDIIPTIICRYAKGFVFIYGGNTIRYAALNRNIVSP